jgi:hypothetical protein
MRKSILLVLIVVLATTLGLLLMGCSPTQKVDKAPAKASQPQVPASSPPPPQCTITVQSGQSIQQAINKAAEGAIICVAAGSFIENLTIHKSVTLQGAGQGQVTITATALATPVLRIASSTETLVEVHHFILTAKAGSWDASMVIEGKAKVVLQDVQLAGRGIGLHVKDSAQVTAQNAQISHNSVGCIAEGASQVTFQDSQIVSNDTDGLRVSGSAQVSLKNTKVSGNRNSGLLVGDASRVNLSDSTVSDNGFAGLYAGSANDKAEIDVTNTKVSGNRYAGLLIRGSAHLTLSSSPVSDNGSDGLFLEDEAQARVLNSTISGNKGHGMQVGIPGNLLECKGNIMSKNAQGDYNSGEVAQRCK